MRTKNILISECHLMYVIAGQLFKQAPNGQPRNTDIIMQKVKDVFRKDAYNINEYYSLVIPESDVYNYMKTMMMSIPEFVDLNLTQVEYENNISVDDETIPKYSFVTNFDKYDSESWKNNFIDLDAYIMNVYTGLIALMYSEQDCSCCKKQKSEDCITCFVNPDIEYKFEPSRKPKGNFTFSCKFDCKEQNQICCEECNKKDICQSICDGKSDICGNKVMD